MNTNTTAKVSWMPAIAAMLSMVLVSMDLFMTPIAKPNHATIGPRYKQQTKQIIEYLTSIDPQKLASTLKKDKKIVFTIDTESITLSIDDFTFQQQEKPDIAKTDLEDKSIILDTTLTPELEAEGLARELIRRIQSMRKDQNLDVEQKITTELHLPPIKEPLLKTWLSHIATETRSQTITYSKTPKGIIKKWTIDDLEIEIGIKI